MAREFSTCVEYGLSLSKRIYYGKEMTPEAAAAAAMTRSISSKSSRLAESYLPTAVMAYAVIPEPELVDNPDVPSYQPYVHGRCEPPALIPLLMHGAVAMEIDCCFDHANVCFSGAWRVHCVKASRMCDVRIAVPMGEQGSLLGVEVDVTGRSYHSQLIQAEDANDNEKLSKGWNGRLIKGSLYSFVIPEVGGGSTFSIKVTWSQKLLYHEGQFSLNLPFRFPAFVNPIGKMISKREKILLNVNSGVGKEILFRCTSHALKELRREAGKMGLLYDTQVLTWSRVDFNFSYSVYSKDLFGVLLQSPFLRDFDDRQMFCCYLFPGNNQSMKAFRKEVMFLIDISGSMKGDPFEGAKNGLLSSLQKLNPEDSFNIIAFNVETYLFSSLMERATEEAILKATLWLSDKLTADGGTNILAPLKQAIKMLAETADSIPLIFLITDGTVEDERDICNFVKGSLTCRGSISLRICTFGIGTYCNHYFLRMLAQIGRGHFDTAYDADSVDFRMQRLFTTASSIILANITVDDLECQDSLELLPFCIPDLSCGCPLIVSGRFSGNFPDSVKLSGILADMRKFTIDIKAPKAKDLPSDGVIFLLDMTLVVARRQIDLLTASAWLSGSKELEQKVAKLSIQTGVPSEYTLMVLHHTLSEEKASETILAQDVVNKIKKMKLQTTIMLGNLCVGFGNLRATAENIPPGTEETKPTEMLFNAASNCCSRVVERCCCMCFIQTCSHMNNQCSIVLSQLCGALACFECLNCCFELCECG